MGDSSQSPTGTRNDIGRTDSCTCDLMEEEDISRRRRSAEAEYFEDDEIRSSTPTGRKGSGTGCRRCGKSLGRKVGRVVHD